MFPFRTKFILKKNLVAMLPFITRVHKGFKFIESMRAYGRFSR